MMRFKTSLLMTAGALAVAQPLLAQSSPPSPMPASGSAATLEEEFRDPPQSARPRVWWHWMNGNISKDGIAKDMAWMKRVGIGGLQNFDANIKTPQIVDKRIVYMTPEWKDAFRFAASEADRLGLELTIASSPGWSETGGPWVPPQDAMKKLVWSETSVNGGRPFAGELTAPPTATGPYQGIQGDPEGGLNLSGGEMPPLPAPFYKDVAVLAYPAGTAERLAIATYKDTAGVPMDADALADGDYATALTLPKPASGAPVLFVDYDKPQTLRSASLFMPGAGNLYFGGSFAPRLEASDDGKAWRPVAEIAPELVPTTVSFAPVTARHFRIVFNAPKAQGFSFPPPPAGLDFATVGDLGGSNPLAPKPVRIAELRLSSQDRIDHAEAKAAYTILPDYFQVSNDVPDTQGVAPAKVIDLTTRLRPDGSLDWTPPRGQWRVLRLGYSLVGTMNHPAPKEATGLEVDKFDGAAVQRYLDQYLGMYKDAAGADMIGQRGVKGFLNDSIEVGAANWTPAMVTQFKRLRGYDPTPWMPALTGQIVGSRSQSDAFLYDYRRTLADLMASEHYGTIAKVAHENGLIVYGEALEIERPSLGDDMAMRRYTDVPMSALWVFSRAMGPSPAYLVDMRGAASVAHVYGQNLVAAESMTSLLAPWAYGPNDLKRIIDLEFVTGVNRPVVHTSVHVPVDDKKPGLALSIHGQYFNRNEAWAKLAKPWVDYIARNSLMLQQGRNVADVAYFYGEEAPLTGLYSEKTVPDAPKKVGYDFINADALLDAVHNEGDELVTSGGARYKALYLGGSSSHMTLPTLQKIAALVEGGAAVIGHKPTANPSLNQDAALYTSLTDKLWSSGETTRVGKGRVIVADDAEKGLVLAGIPADFEWTGAQPDTDVLFVHRRLNDGDSYFLSNRKNRTETIEARFRVQGKQPELWHAETGTSEPVSYRIEDGITVVPLTLAADESVHVVFRRPATAASLDVASPKLVPASTVSGPWRVTFEPGRGAPAAATLNNLIPLDEHPDPAIRYFSGIATYRNTFTTPQGWKGGQPLWLDLGEAKEIAEVTINGKLAGSTWHAPYRIDISAITRPGRNALSIRVANLWVNRMIGDRQPGASKVTFTTGPTYTAKAPLRRSGLIGPVTVQTSR